MSLSSGMLSGKVALVTGGSRGIGAGIVKRLAKEGAAVAFTYAASREKAEQLAHSVEAGGGTALAIHADRADAAAVQGAIDQTVKTLGRLDVFVNNAGILLAGTIDQVSLEDLDKMLAVNVRSVYVGIQAAASHMAEGGRIVTIGSVVAQRTAVPGASTYSMTKSAVAGLATDAPFWLLRELVKPRLAYVASPRLILLGHLLDTHVMSGDLAQARRVWEGSDLSSSARAFDWLFATGEFEQAEIVITSELERSQRAGSRAEEGAYATLLARIRWALGDLAEAERLGRIALEKAKRDVPGELHTRSLLAGLYAEMGCPERAHPHLTRCREIIGNGEDWRGLAGKVALAEAVVAAAEGKYEEAEAQFERSIQIFRRYHVPFEEAEALHYRGRALNASGELAQANEKLDAAIKIYRRCGAGERWVDRVEADKPPKVAPLRSRTEKGEDAAGGVRSEAVFWREGDYWTVTYEGETWRLKGAKGFHYIAYLLGHPREEIRALDLAAPIGGAGEEAVNVASAGDLARTDALTGDLGHAGEMLDAQAKADYQRRLIELEDELAEARELGNEERIAKAEEEKEALAREIRRAVGLGGRDRRAASSAQRARVAVTKAIRLALERISVHNRDLGRLLSTTIKTGAICSYVPDDKLPISWRL